jgi:ATP-dependent RNA helicase MSS116
LLHEDEERGFKRWLGQGAWNIKENSSLKTANLDMSRASQLPQNVADIMNMIQGGVKAAPRSVKVDVYHAMLSVLGQSSGGTRTKQDIVDMLNNLARYGWGMEKPPGMNPALVSKLGFSRCRGIETYDRYSDGKRESGFTDRSGSSRGGRGGRRDDYDERDPFGKEPIGFGNRGGDRGGFGKPSSGFGNRGGFGGASRGGKAFAR